MFYNEQYVPVGVAVVQLLHFTNREINVEDLYDRFGHLIPERKLSELDVKIMLCGNAFCTGEHGFLFCKSISDKVAKLNLSRALHRLKRDEKKANKGVSAIMLKDFWPSSFDKIEVLKHEDYSEFMIDVNMVVSIHDNWLSYDDYLNDMITKFRTKVKGIYKKSAAVSGKQLSADEIKQNGARIDELYHNVLDKADYRFGELNSTTFYKFANKLPEDFVFMGYFIDDKLVGFSSSFKGGVVFDANFVGIDYAFNHDYAIYQRMLCDLVKLSIEAGVKELRFGRTAEQMKSCFGAEPVEMKLLVKHRNAITNKLLKHLIHHISPNKFEIRRPFKAVIYEQA